MSNRTKIEWTDSSWNPITGCTKVSSGCENCYAETFAKRLKAMHNPRYKNGFKVTVHEDLIEAPLMWKTPKKIFVNSMSDLFHEELSDEIILRIFGTMNEADWHIYQILTKRSKRLKDLSNKVNWTNNIWMGVTVEDEECLYRVNDLKETGAKIKFISAEPLLTALDTLDLDEVDWIIVGGESGHRSRPMEKEWVANIKNKAREKNVPFFFKQWGGSNKKKAGRLLDGRIYDEFPEVIET